MDSKMKNNLQTLAYTSDNPRLDYRVVFRKIRQGNLSYFLGRFRLFRLLYSRYKSFEQLLWKTEPLQKFKSQIINRSSFSVQEIVEFVDQNSYYDQIELTESSVNSIFEAAKERKLTSSQGNSSFTYDEYLKLEGEHRLAMAKVINPLEIDEIYRLRYDEFLLDVSEKYLGYYPEKCDVNLWWSFADNLSAEDRRNQFQTIDYHYDIHGFNFFYVSFYLTDTDNRSGAHVLVKGSHKNKKISMLFRSARVPETMIQENYSEKDIIEIQGKAGTCFLEDAACFHKALVPIERDRLFLQLRYF